MVNFIEAVMWMTLNVYFEARGEEQRGMMDVVHVVHNRCQIRKMTVPEVIKQSNQFSWVNKNAEVQRLVNNTSLVYDLIRCIKAVYLAEAERLQGDNRGMIDHYFNPNRVLPSWAKKLKHVRDVGNHTFYTSIGGE